MEKAHLFIYVHVFHLITYFVVVRNNPLTTYVTWSSK